MTLLKVLEERTLQAREEKRIAALQEDYRDELEGGCHE